MLNNQYKIVFDKYLNKFKISNLIDSEHERVDIEGVVSTDQIILSDFHVSITIHSGHPNKIKSDH